MASRLQRMLVVDDNIDAADMLADVLRLSGVEVRVAHSGPAALAIGAEFSPDAILLDLVMPGMHGYETARRIRQEAWGRSVILIAVSGLAHQEARDRAAGFDRTLLKPASPERLAAVLGLTIPSAETPPAF